MAIKILNNGQDNTNSTFRASITGKSQRYEAELYAIQNFKKIKSLEELPDNYFIVEQATEDKSGAITMSVKVNREMIESEISELSVHIKRLKEISEKYA